MHKYSLEFILDTQGVSIETIKNSLIEFGESLDIAKQGRETGEFKVCMRTQDPTIIFDACAQLGRIKSVKVNEINQGQLSI